MEQEQKTAERANGRSLCDFRMFSIVLIVFKVYIYSSKTYIKKA
jgi:hypothetical protein